MGSTAAIAANVDRDRVDRALALVADLEARWSRFVETSAISIINRARGPVVVDRRTAALLALTLEGRTVTDGWFDPTLDGSPFVAHETTGFVHTDPGTRLDLGAVAKGRTADLVTEILIGDAGAATAVASIGGDVRVRSTVPVEIEVSGPSEARPALLRVQEAGIAMSGPTGRADHLIDPSRSRPPRSARVALIVARTAAGAEMLATAASIAPLGDAVDLLRPLGVAAWLVEADGTLTTVGRPDAFLADEGWLADAAARRWRNAG